MKEKGKGEEAEHFFTPPYNVQDKGLILFLLRIDAIQRS